MTNTLEQGSMLRRWLWFVGLWITSVGTIGAISLVIKFWLN